LLDREDEVKLVEDNFAQFQKLYRPIYEDQFRDSFEITSDGTFIKDTKDQAARRHLMSYVNDNVY